MAHNNSHIVFKAGDYLVAAPEPGQPSKKFHLVKATDIGGSTVTGWLESARKGLAVEKVEIKVNRFVASLGPKPEPGKVYGLDLTNRFRKRLEHDFWGNVLVFTYMDNAQLKLMQRSLDRTAKQIDKMGLAPFVDFIDTHLVAKQGKWAGRYQHSRDQEKERAIISYAPEYAELNPDMMDYIVYHEFGHCIRYNGVTGKKIKLKWLVEYNRSIQPIEISNAQLREIYKYLESYAEAETSLAAIFREYANEEEENKLYIRGLLRWFQEVHHLGPRDLAVIWDGQDMSVFKELWPTKAIDSSKLSPVMTEYATKNVEELFAETYAFYCQKKKIPPRLQLLMEGSLQYAKAHIK